MKKRTCARNFRLVKAWEGYKQRECLKEMIEFFFKLTAILCIT